MEKKALILLGCPEVPSQTPLAIYLAYKIFNSGYDVTIAANPAASRLIRVSDPEKFYVKKLINIDRCLGELDQGQYDLLVGFAHKDAAASYFVTFNSILQCKSLAIVFERDGEVLDELISIVDENTDAEIISAIAHHNPNPIKVQIDRKFKEVL